MNDPHGFTKENLLSSLPIALANDPKMVALAEAIAGLFVQQKEETGRLSLYPRIGELDEALLDILAHDFKVDWWDSDYTLEEKRRTLQSSWAVHRLLGTKAAVELAASAVYPETTVQEWFEYGGEPYYFRLNVQLSEGMWDKSKHKRLMQRLQYYKNLRSHLEPVVYLMPPTAVQNRNCFLFVEQSFLVRANNFGIEEILLNGRTPLDGSYDLSVSFHKGVALQRLLWRCRMRNQQILSGTLLLPAAARNVFSTIGKTAYRISGKNRQKTLQHYTPTVHARNPQSIRGSLTAAVDNRLDGEFVLNGSRKLYTGISRREL